MTAALATGKAEVLQLLLGHGAGDEQEERMWMGMRPASIAVVSGRKNTAVMRVLGAYESQFTGAILPEDGCACVASWPGIYCERWDELIAKGNTVSTSLGSWEGFRTWVVSQIALQRFRASLRLASKFQRAQSELQLGKRECIH